MKKTERDQQPPRSSSSSKEAKKEKKHRPETDELASVMTPTAQDAMRVLDVAFVEEGGEEGEAEEEERRATQKSSPRERRMTTIKASSARGPNGEDKRDQGDEPSAASSIISAPTVLLLEIADDDDDDGGAEVENDGEDDEDDDELTAGANRSMSSSGSSSSVSSLPSVDSASSTTSSGSSASRRRRRAALGDAFGGTVAGGGGAARGTPCPACGRLVDVADYQETEPDGSDNNKADDDGEADHRAGCRLATMLADPQTGLLTLRPWSSSAAASGRNEEPAAEHIQNKVHFLIDAGTGQSSRVAPVGDGSVATLAAYDSLNDLQLIASTLLQKGYRIQGRLAIG